jgi:long-chain acyl-CoA synthetase
MLNYAALLAGSCARHGARSALQFEDTVMTYRELDIEVERMAHLLRSKGLVGGDRVAVMAPNLPQFVVAFWGAIRAGCVVVPMNPLLKGREAEYYLQDSGAKAFIHDATSVDPEVHSRADGLIARWTIDTDPSPDRVPADTDLDLALRSIVLGEPHDLGYLEPTNADDPAVLLYTSGTTGRPKGAVLTHSNLSWNVRIFATTCLELTEDDVVFGALPLFHSFGQTAGMGSALSTGACLSLLRRFTGDAAINLIRENSVTVMLGVPTMYTAMLSAVDAGAPKLDSLRVCLSGGAAAPLELLRRFEAEFGCRVLEGYGLSETSPAACVNHPDRPSKVGSIGTPIWGTEMRVVDPDGQPLPAGGIGEIQIRGHNVMAGYFNRPDETAAVFDGHGWFRTGDLAYIDDDGYFFVVDRKKDLIIRGGFNVYPREIEEVLYEHPAVLEAAVLARPDDTLGEEVVAVVAVRPGHPFDAAVLQDWCKERLAAYKYPRLLLEVKELPKGPTGKIVKRDIRLAELLPQP